MRGGVVAPGELAGASQRRVEAEGRLEFPMDLFEATMRDMGFDVLPILAAHAIAAGALPRHHGDPFDRMLVAQARLGSVSRQG